MCLQSVRAAAAFAANASAAIPLLSYFHTQRKCQAVAASVLWVLCVKFATSLHQFLPHREQLQVEANTNNKFTRRVCMPAWHQAYSQHHTAIVATHA